MATLWVVDYFSALIFVGFDSTKEKNDGFLTVNVYLSNTMASLTVSLFSCRWLLATSPDGHPSGVIKSFGEK